MTADRAVTRSPTEAPLAASTVTMTVLTGVSRATGLIRIVVVGAVIGDTFLGNTYQSTNTVPNLIFELMAAGVFQAVLIPALVSFLDQRRRDDAEHIAGSVFGVSLVGLSAVALVGMIASPWIAQVLFSGSDEAVRADQIRLGTIFLLVFLPQVGMYAAGMVATAALNAQHRFAIPAIAPAVNNVIVCIGYGLFWWSRAGAEPSLDLTNLQILYLAGFTTAGVVGFCALPLLALRRTDFTLRPRLDWRHGEVQRIVRMGGWAAGFLASTQILIAVELLLANRVRGGVVALQIGWTFFLLPFALFAQPVLTALFPRMSSEFAAGDDVRYGRSVETGTEFICLFAIPSAIALGALAPAVSRALLFGAIDEQGAADIARVVAAFAPGMVGYGMLLFLARAFYARLDARTPTVVNLAAAIVGAVAMALTAGLASTSWQVPLLAAIHAAVYVAAALVIALILRRRVSGDARPHLLRRLRPQILATPLVLAAAVVVGRSVPTDERSVALAGAVVVGGATFAAFVGLTALFGGPKPTEMVRSLRGGIS